MFNQNPFRVLMYPFLLIAGMFGLTRWFGREWDTFMMQLCGSAFGLLWEVGMIGRTWFEMLADDTPPAPKPAAPVNVPIKSYGNFVRNTQTVEAVSIDKTRQFARVILDMLDHGTLDLKEDRWKAHFGGRDKYVHVRDVQMAGAFAKEFDRDNSPFTVVDRRVVERAAGTWRQG